MTYARFAFPALLVVLGLLGLGIWSSTAGSRVASTTLSVFSQPQGASVYVNHGDAAGTTPMQEMAIEPGMQTVTIEADGYVTRDTTLFVEEGMNTLSVSLRRAYDLPQAARTTLSVSSDPEGAAVRLDFAEPVGTTPLDAVSIAPGWQVVTFEADGYTTRDTLLRVTPGDNQLHVSLRPLGSADGQWTETRPLPRPTADELNARSTTPRSSRTGATTASASRTTSASTARTDGSGTMLVASEPSGASVLLDDVPQGNTPVVLEDVQAGEHLVVISRDGYADFRETITVEADQMAQVMGRLDPQRGLLSVMVDPWGSIYIDGKLRRQDTDIEYRTELSIGRHIVRVTHPTLGTWEREVEITGHAPKELFVTFPGAATASLDGGEVASSPRSASTSARDPDSVYSFTDTPPQIIGGWKALYASAQYPVVAQQAGLEGRVYLNIVVDPDGHVKEARVVQGLGGGLDKEAMRLIKDARFEPATVEGRPVTAELGTFIQFSLR